MHSRGIFSKCRELEKEWPKPPIRQFQRAEEIEQFHDLALSRCCTAVEALTVSRILQPAVVKDTLRPRNTSAEVLRKEEPKGDGKPQLPGLRLDRGKATATPATTDATRQIALENTSSSNAKQQQQELKKTQCIVNRHLVLQRRSLRVANAVIAPLRYNGYSKSNKAPAPTSQASPYKIAPERRRHGHGSRSVKISSSITEASLRVGFITTTTTNNNNNIIIIIITAATPAAAAEQQEQ